MLQPPEEFTTSRLRLRRYRQSDAAAIFAGYARDPQVTRYLSWPAHETLADSEAFLADTQKWWEAGSSFVYALTRPDNDGVIGSIGFRPKEATVTFGYVLARACWGRGFMPEALAALVDWCLAQPSIWRADAFCHVDNKASARVMEKAGMALEGRLRAWDHCPNLSEEPQDFLVYARVRT